jgi:hypothetical protein
MRQEVESRKLISTSRVEEPDLLTGLAALHSTSVGGILVMEIVDTKLADDPIKFFQTWIFSRIVRNSGGIQPI